MHEQKNNDMRQANPSVAQLINQTKIVMIIINFIG